MGRHKSKRSKRDRSSSSESVSSGDERREKQRGRRSNVEEETSLINFSFLDHKLELNRIVLGNSFRDQLVENTSDLWLFVQKYEGMLKKTGKCTLPRVTESLDKVPKEFPTEFKSIHLNNLRFAVSVEEILRRSGHGGKLSKTQIMQFLQIVLQYLDFRQKEKFSKLRKLREAQANLPVAKFKEEIVTAVQNERVVLLAGDTGCGKSTQIPQYLHQAGFKGIGCTQPRRIACISLSKRVSHEMLCEYGTQVGYQIRFERSKTKDTNIIFLTEGLLLRQLSQEAMLSQFSCIVLDEIHERHLHGDFLLGVAKCLIKVRPDLKLVLMSATINLKLFSDYFTEEEAHVIEVPGRLFPIKLHYMPQFKDVPSASGSRSSKSERLSPEPYIQIMQLVDQKYPPTERGDMLIFMSGLNEIQTIVDAALEYAAAKNNWIVLPLHSSLSIADQDKVFDYAPAGVRKCIVSTNIAETSVTIDGIRFVVDSGKVKEMSFDPSCKLSRLKEFSISRASADQRKGRAGRTGAGVCYRLYTEKQYQDFEAYSAPEIHRVPLENLLLQMVSMGLPNARLFPFIEPPPAGSIESSIVSLKQHGAMTVEEKLTPIGQALSRLPVDLSISKMLLMGCVFSQLQPVLTLAATLSVQSPFTNRAYRDKECENARKDLESDHGDPITLLNSYKEWLELKRLGFDRRNDVQNTQTWCRRRGLEEQRFYEITKLRKQFEELLTDSGLIPVKEAAKMTSSERAMRHGELRQLKELKKTHKMEAPRKRNVLKQTTGFMADEDEGQQGTDIRDVEFRLSHDPSKMKSLLSGATASSYRDLMTLKLILVSGMYPQVAISDEFNYCKAPSQHFFHTTAKPFTSLHPMGFFGNNGQVLQLDDSEIIDKPMYYKSKLPLSAKHQLLCYQSLLETTKPYLMNTMRMPAAQTLFLFAHEIDTNGSCSKVICDSWLCLEFPHAEAGMMLLQKACQLRHLWTTLLNQRLEALAVNKGVEAELGKSKREEDSDAIEKELWMQLANFMNTQVYYTIKRILPADLKTIYVGFTGVEGDELELEQQRWQAIGNEFAKNFVSQPNMIKGGWFVSENVTINSVHETDWSVELENQFVENGFSCPACENTFHVTMLEKLQHVKWCEEQRKQQLVVDSSEIGGASDRCVEKLSASSVVAANHYQCLSCGENLTSSTAVDKLRHRKRCQGGGRDI